MWYEIMRLIIVGVICFYLGMVLAAWLIRREHGRWVEGQKNWYVCSVCYAHAGLYGGGVGQNLSHYCPNCGAKMDGGHDDG